MSLTPLEKELLGYVKRLSEACELSVNTSTAQIQSLSASLELLMESQNELVSALNGLASEEINFEKLTTSLSNAGQKLIIAENRLKEMSGE